MVSSFALDFSKTLLILLRGKTKSKIFVKAKRQRQPVWATKEVRQETFSSFNLQNIEIRFDAFDYTMSVLAFKCFRFFEVCQLSIQIDLNCSWFLVNHSVF